MNLGKPVVIIVYIKEHDIHNRKKKKKKKFLKEVSHSPRLHYLIKNTVKKNKTKNSNIVKKNHIL